jgi:hypothetical protein
MQRGVDTAEAAANIRILVGVMLCLARFDVARKQRFQPPIVTSVMPL